MQLVTTNDVVDVETQLRRERVIGWQIFAAIIALTAITGLIATNTAPAGFSVAFIGLIIASAAAFVRPAVGVHFVVFFSLLGDDQTAPWYPFTKNLSSRESMFFVGDGFSMTPMEIVVVVTAASFLLRALADTEWRLKRGRLLWPMLILFGFVIFGFFKGYLTGHDRTIAILEMRPMVYIPLLYVLITNLFTTKRQYRITFALATVAMGISSIFSLGYWRGLSDIAQQELEALSEHTASVTLDIVFVFVLGLIVFRGSRWKKWALVPLLIPMIISFVLSQRRAGMVALFAGIVVMFAVLFMRDRRRFWHIAPVFTLVALLLVIGTWGATGGLGLPANAVKTVLFPGQLEAADESSNLYRELEAYNLWFTIRESPLTGFGFGQPFIVVRPMPDISFFEYWQYLPHNSVLWVWIKTGFLGFVSMLFLFARGIQRGAQTAMRTAKRDDLAMVVAGTAYLVMFLVFAYVDIGWSIRPAVMLALCFAMCADFGELDDPVVAPDQRLLRPVSR